MSAALVTLLLWMPALPYSIPAMAMANRRDLERHRHPELRAWLKRLYVNGETNLVVAHWANIAGVAAAAAVLTRL